MPEAPPLRYRIPYFLFGTPVPAAWRGWVEADVDKRLFVSRRFIFGAALLTVGLIYLIVANPSDPLRVLLGFSWFYVFLGVMTALGMTKRVRETSKNVVLGRQDWS